TSRSQLAATGPGMREVAIIGVGTHATGQFTEKPLKELAYTAVWGALDDAGVAARDINVAYVGNSLAGLLTGQEGVRGQVVLQHSGITGIPIVNVENACASAATGIPVMPECCRTTWHHRNSDRQRGERLCQCRDRADDRNS